MLHLLMSLYRIFVQKTLGKSYLKMNNRSKVQGSDLPAGRPAHRNTMEGVEAGCGRFFCEKPICKLLNVDEPVKSRKVLFSVILAKVLRQAQDREPIERPESSRFNAFWMPDQVRHDDFETFYETINVPHDNCFYEGTAGKCCPIYSGYRKNVPET